MILSKSQTQYLKGLQKLKIIRIFTGFKKGSSNPKAQSTTLEESHSRYRIKSMVSDYHFPD